MNIIRHQRIFLVISGILMLASIMAIAVWGLKLGIDFTGGSVMEVSYASARPAAEAITADLRDTGVDGATVQFSGERDALLRFRTVDESTHQKILAALGKDKSFAVSELRFDAIGPTIGAEFKQRAIGGVALAILAIILYIAWAFRRVSRPVASWKY